MFEGDDPVAFTDCCLCVDCAAIRSNLDALRQKTKSRIVAVVKNDGYGLALVEYARLLTTLGVGHLAAGSCEEALALTDAGIGASILLLTPQASEAAAGELMRRGVALTVGSVRQADTVRSAARAAGMRARIHIKIDTGLGRYGFTVDQLQHVSAAVRGMEVLGTYTHFASPYADPKRTRRQFDAFLQAVEQLRSNGVDPGMLHCCASGGFLNYPGMHLDAVRLGSAILGRVPDAGRHGLTPAVFLKAPILSIKAPNHRMRIGYRGAVGIGRGRRIGVVGVGGAYAAPQAGRAAALFRARQYAAVNGSRARVLGHLGVGALALDLTGVQCLEGDMARLEVNPLHCSGLLRRIFDYGADCQYKNIAKRSCGSCSLPIS